MIDNNPSESRMMSDQQWEAHMERVREAFHADDRPPDPAFVDEWQKLGKGRRARETFRRGGLA